MRHAAHHADTHARPPPSDHEYAFLVGRRIDWTTLEKAEAEAARSNIAAHHVLLATGWISHADYAFALAEFLAVPCVLWNSALELVDPEAARMDTAAEIEVRLDGRYCRVLLASSAPPSALAARVAVLRAHGIEAAVTYQLCLDAALDAYFGAERLHRAVHHLRRIRPVESARTRTPGWQLAASVAVPGFIVGGFAVLPRETASLVAAAAAVAFLCITLLRVAALGEAVAALPRTFRKRRIAPARLPDHTLPTYSILVPLYREANVLHGLIGSLRALDYPLAKLEIILVVEAIDTATLAAVLESELPGNVRTVVVPDDGPRTKPKALNYALRAARGDYVVVYDAEDRPEADQLRRAVEAFRHAGSRLACVQARLNIYNARQSWLTRQFAVEYSVLFDALLPALERLGLPLPLGGTSNHFPRKILIAAGEWDPFNMTEDADLGIRLARLGLRTTVLDSTTWEEAPPAFRPWLKQRTRWLKGWMQTYGVHTRRPARLHRELGLWAAFGFHVLMGGLILSALVHPWFYLLVIYHAIEGDLFAPAATALDAMLWTFTWTNVAAGYSVSILAGVVSVLRRGRLRLALSAFAMPFYWLLISIAAYRALYQLVRAPYLWEKTTHGTAADLPSA